MGCVWCVKLEMGGWRCQSPHVSPLSLICFCLRRFLRPLTMVWNINECERGLWNLCTEVNSTVRLINESFCTRQRCRLLNKPLSIQTEISRNILGEDFVRLHKGYMSVFKVHSMFVFFVCLVDLAVVLDLYITRYAFSFYRYLCSQGPFALLLQCSTNELYRSTYWHLCG